MKIEVGRLSGVFQPESAGLISTAGLVIISYMGLTKVASVAEEVKNPDRLLNFPTERKISRQNWVLGGVASPHPVCKPLLRANAVNFLNHHFYYELSVVVVYPIPGVIRPTLEV